MSFRDLDLLSDEVAAGFAARGLGAGDVVALVLPSSPDYLVAYAGAAKAGVVTTGVNPRLAPEQRAAVLDVAGPSLVVSTPALDTPAAAETVLIDLATNPDDTLRPLRSTDATPTATQDDGHPVAIVFTSGTTGAPKGAVFTGRQLRAIALLDVGDRHDGGGPMLASTELVHIGVMTKLPWYLRTGATLHLLRKWRAPDALRLISQHRMASIGAIAPQVALLLRQPDFDTFDLGAVRTIVAGGAPSPPALVVEARRRFDAAYSTRYSSTESGGVGTGTAFDADDEEALHTVGRPRDGVELEVRSDDGTVLPQGETGVIWLRSPAVMAAYWRDPEATAQTLVDGWLRTDDLGVVDDRGCVRLAGRRSDVFIRGGYNVHPQTVEAVLGRHPAVREVAVLPAPDPVLGDVGMAVVVPVDPLAPPSLDELRDFATDHLARHELPEQLRLAADLPRTHVDKIDRTALKESLRREAT